MKTLVVTEVDRVNKTVTLQSSESSEVTETPTQDIWNGKTLPISKPFEAFSEAELREWNNVFRTNQSYIDPTPIKLEMDILELRLSETKRADRYSDIVTRLEELQDKLVEAYDR